MRRPLQMAIPLLSGMTTVLTPLFKPQEPIGWAVREFRGHKLFGGLIADRGESGGVLPVLLPKPG
jgi:hypothetical protein